MAVVEGMFSPEELLGGAVPINPNMRVAGQVVGGQYSAIVPSQAAALQEASTASYAHYTDTIRRQNLSLASQSDAEAFPSLDGGARASTAAPNTGAGAGADLGVKRSGSGTKLHELSLVNRRRAALQEQRERAIKEKEERRAHEEARLRRTEQLASSFGIARGMTSMSMGG